MNGAPWKQSGDEERLLELWEAAVAADSSIDAAAFAREHASKLPDRSVSAIQAKVLRLVNDGRATKPTGASWKASGDLGRIQELWPQFRQSDLQSAARSMAEHFPGRTVDAIAQQIVRMINSGALDRPAGDDWDGSGDTLRLLSLWSVLGVADDFSVSARAIAPHLPGRTNAAIRLQLGRLSRSGQLPPPVQTEIQDGEQIRRDTKLEQAKAQAEKLQRLYREAIKGLAVQEALVETVKRTVQSIDPVPAGILEEPSSGGTPETDILDLSDLHVGDTVDGEQMRGMNEYDFSMFKRRLQYLVDSIIGIRRQRLGSMPAKRLVVNMLGDNVTGLLHDKPEYAEGEVTERCWVTAIVLTQAIQELAQVWPEVTVNGVVGNESRMTVKKKHRHRYVNWDYMLYTSMQALLRSQSNVSFHIPKSFFTLVEIEGFNHLLYHGDDIKSWAGIPFYGIQRAIGQFTQLLAEENTRLDYVHLGHFHQGTSLPKYSGEVFVNGSVIGPDEWAFVALRAGGTPHQWFMGCHPEHGVTYRYRVNLKAAERLVPESRYHGALDGDVSEMLEEFGT